MSVVLVIAKAPVAGLAKTRLCPPATPGQAAAIAAAALLDTLEAVSNVPSVRPVLAYTGPFADAEAALEIRTALTGWRLMPQRGKSFGERLANAHADTATLFPGRPVLQIGMDTPQVRPGLLGDALHRLADTDAVLGMAADGGWWALGLRDPMHAGALRDVPMSTPDTGRLTRLALSERRLRTASLPVLSDVDTWQDALVVAKAAPDTRFAAALSPLSPAGGWEVAFAGGEQAAGGARPGGHWLVDTGGEVTPLPIHRWQGPPERAVRAVVDQCTGPTVDVGCGPGRVAAELADRGLVSLGIDISAQAVRLTRRRGATALRHDVFDPLPAEGRWSHALLLDGNIGIGGDPTALLRRCSALLAPGGTVLVELDAPGAGKWQGTATILCVPSRRRSQSFPWARVGVEAVHQVAAGAHLTVRTVFQRDGRWFAELERQ
jgi:glycosyltransferase A (GT-A) superfamily protein (DUF2064 family)/SAM-dependent methyltransferase